MAPQAASRSCSRPAPAPTGNPHRESPGRGHRLRRRGRRPGLLRTAGVSGGWVTASCAPKITTARPSDTDCRSPAAAFGRRRAAGIDDGGADRRGCSAARHGSCIARKYTPGRGGHDGGTPLVWLRRAGAKDAQRCSGRRVHHFPVSSGTAMNSTALRGRFISEVSYEVPLTGTTECGLAAAFGVPGRDAVDPGDEPTKHRGRYLVLSVPVRGVVIHSQPGIGQLAGGGALLRCQVLLVLFVDDHFKVGGT